MFAPVISHWEWGGTLVCITFRVLLYIQTFAPYYGFSVTGLSPLYVFVSRS